MATLLDHRQTLTVPIAARLTARTQPGSVNLQIYVTISCIESYGPTDCGNSPVLYHSPRGNQEDHQNACRTALHSRFLVPSPFSALPSLDRWL